MKVNGTAVLSGNQFYVACDRTDHQLGAIDQPGGIFRAQALAIDNQFGM